MNSIEKKLAAAEVNQEQDNTSSAPRATDPAKVNWSYWARMPGWRMREAAALLLAIEPGSMGGANKNENDLTAQYHNHVRMLLRSHQMELINSPVAPREFLEWAKSNNLMVPSPLEEAVEKGQQLRDWRALAVNRRKRLKTLKAQLAEGGSDINSKSLNSLLAMVLGMAVTKYRFSSTAGRSSTATNIESDLLQLGITITAQTIRFWLDKAEEKNVKRTPKES